MKSKLTAMAACLLLGGLASLADASGGGPRPNAKCFLIRGRVCCLSGFPCHCISGSSTVAPGVTATWCRDRGPTC
jgi:hypothetical protein